MKQEKPNRNETKADYKTIIRQADVGRKNTENLQFDLKFQ